MSAVFIQPVQLAVGAAMTIDFIGTFCYFRQSDTTQDLIEIRPDTQQGVLQLLPGQGFGFGSPVNRWIVKNIGTTNITVGQLVIADGDYRDQRVVGSMQVVGTASVAVADAAKARVLAAASFMGANRSPAGGAGNYSRSSLWNPPTNPNRLIVQAVGLYNLDMANPSAASLQTITAAPSFLGSTFGANKKLGGVASVARATTDTQTGAGAVSPMVLEVAAQRKHTLVLTDPIVVPPGYGLSLWGINANQEVSGSFEWYEEPNV